MLVSRPHLFIEVILDEVPECQLLAQRLVFCRHLALFVFPIARCEGDGLILGVHLHLLRPLTEGGRAVGVAADAIDSIGEEPFLVGTDKRFVVSFTFNIRSLLLVECPQIAHLSLVDTFVVNLCESVQLVAQRFIVQTCLLILERRQLSEVSILRMECINADAVIRIGVLPGVGDGRVVDREHLQSTLPRHRCPVDHSLQVAEVTHTETPFRAQ